MRGAGVSSIVQGALALAVLALLQGATHARADHPSCAELQRSLQYRRIINTQEPCGYGEPPLSVSLYWRSAPARVAAALMAAQLRYVYGCASARLVEGRHNTSVQSSPDSTEVDKLDIDFSTALASEAVQDEEDSGVEVQSLSESDISSDAPQRQLYAWLSPAARSLDICQNTTWKFYFNLTNLALCDFISPLSNLDIQDRRKKIFALEVFGVGDDCISIIQQLQLRAFAAGFPVFPLLVNQTATMKRSFLFLDYDLWKGEPAVSAVVSPACIDHHCNNKLEVAIDMSVATIELLKSAPNVYRFVQDFKPTQESLLQIFGQEANGVDIEEAVCNNILKNESYVAKKFTVVIYLCENDQDNISYDNIISLIHNTTRFYDVSFRRYFTDCSDPNDVIRKLDNLMTDGRNVLGVVSQTVEGAAMASAAAAAYHLPLLLVDVVPEDGAAAPDNTTYRVAGRPRHIARAVQHFVLESGWTRIAVLSQPTRLDRHYLDALHDNAKFRIDDIEIPLKLTKRQAQEALQNLQATNARIVFVNTDSDAAAVILTAAVELNMSYTDGFVWIAREWRQKNVTCGTKHFTVSLWKRDTDGGRYASPHAFALSDALTTLMEGFLFVFRDFSRTQYNLRNAQVIRYLDEILTVMTITDVNGRALHYKDHAIEETSVYVEEWCGDEFTRWLATWRVNATDGAVRGANGGPASYPRPAGMPRDDVAPTPSPRSETRDDADIATTPSPRSEPRDDADIATTPSPRSEPRDDGATALSPRSESDKTKKTPNPVFLLHQWTETITRIEIPTNMSKWNSSTLNMINFINNNIW